MKIGEESLLENEAYYAKLISDRFKEVLKAKYENKSTKRMFHPKVHALVKAQFIVQGDIPKHLKVGIFENEGTYDAWVRFSNAKRNPSPDSKKDMRGMALKLFNVPGKKLLDSDPDATTQDFLLVTAPTLQTKSAQDFQKSIYALTSGGLKLFFFALTHPRVIIKSLQQIKKCSNLLEQTYFSMTPYKLGANQAVKYLVCPQISSKEAMPGNPDPDFLKKRLSRDLDNKDFCFDFLIQEQLDPVKMPIEDPTKRWPSPAVRVATIKIPKQVFNSSKQQQYGEQLSFTPWHSTEDHRPLGGVNRIRKMVYEEIAQFRRKQNGINNFKEPDTRLNFDNPDNSMA